MRKFRVAFYGINHDHCAAKVYEIKKMPDMFEIVGIVCENDEVYLEGVMSRKKQIIPPVTAALV